MGAIGVETRGEFLVENLGDFPLALSVSSDSAEFVPAPSQMTVAPVGLESLSIEFIPAGLGPRSRFENRSYRLTT